jgi:hypothetical protein
MKYKGIEAGLLFLASFSAFVTHILITKVIEGGKLQPGIGV